MLRIGFSPIYIMVILQILVALIYMIAAVQVEKLEFPLIVGDIN